MSRKPAPVVQSPAAPKNFWAGRIVFLTGHTGFKGVWLTLLLEALGAEVHGYSLPPPTRPSLFELIPTRLKAEHRSAIGDVRDRAALAAALDRSGAEIAFHLAAQALVGQARREPAETYEINVQGTVNFLEALRRGPESRAAVVVTSDKCYENDGRSRPFREDDRMGGGEPYASSKGAAELAVRAWRQTFWAESGPLVASARAGNVIGGGDFAEDRLVPDAVLAFAAGRPLALRHPEAVRPWQHVLEPLAGYLDLARGLHRGRRDWAGAWNFGPAPADHWPVGRLATRLAELWGGEVGLEPAAAPAYREAPTLRLSAARARRILGWRPRLGLARALALTMEWYRAHYLRDGDPAAVCVRQVDEYLDLSGIGEG